MSMLGERLDEGRQAAAALSRTELEQSGIRFVPRGAPAECPAASSSADAEPMSRIGLQCRYWSFRNSSAWPLAPSVCSRARRRGTIIASHTTARCGFHRHLDFDRARRSRWLHAAELDADEARHRALRASASCMRSGRRAIDPSATRIAIAPGLDAVRARAGQTATAPRDVCDFRLRGALRAPSAADPAARSCRGRRPPLVASSSATLRSCATTRSRTAASAPW